MFPRLSVPLLAVALTLSSGCGTGAGSPSEGLYPEPALPRAEVAFIEGSQAAGGNIFESAQTGVVLMVDMKFVAQARKRWNQPIPLAPGWHEIVAEYRQADFVGRTTLQLEARAGETYQIQFKNRVEAPDSRRYCDFRIVNLNSGENMTDVHTSLVTGGKRRVTFTAD